MSLRPHSGACMGREKDGAQSPATVATPVRQIHPSFSPFSVTVGSGRRSAIYEVSSHGQKSSRSYGARRDNIRLSSQSGVGSSLAKSRGLFARQCFCCRLRRFGVADRPIPFGPSRYLWLLAAATGVLRRLQIKVIEDKVEEEGCRMKLVAQVVGHHTSM